MRLHNLDKVMYKQPIHFINHLKMCTGIIRINLKYKILKNRSFFTL